MSQPNISITLKAFDKIVNIGVAGSVSSADILPVHITDADARVNVSLEAFTNLFAFYTDYLDVNNVDSSDVFHYIDADASQGTISGDSHPFNIANALTTARPVTNTTPSGSALNPSDLIVKKDYVRHLSKILFNTEYGVDLFVNENELSDSVGLALNLALDHCLADMATVSTKGNDAKLSGVYPHKYLLREYSGSLDDGVRRNICAELLNVLLNSCSSRFMQLQNLEITDQAVHDRIDPSATKLYRLPFIDGDCIVIKVALKPSLQQDWFGESTMLVNGSSVNKSDDQRSYKIELVLKNSPVPPIV
jgi:hypothetical protein